MVQEQWRALIEGESDIIERGGKKKADVDEETVRTLHAKIGELAVANDFFVAKAQAVDRQAKQAMTERTRPTLSIGAPCRLLSISQSPFYCTPRGESVLLLGEVIDRSWRLAVA